MPEPTGLTTLHVSANLFFIELVNKLSIWLLLAGVAMLVFIAVWYFKIRK